MIINEEIKKYDCLFIDVVNFCYKTFKRSPESPIQVGSKLIYKESICNFIKSIDSLADRFLNSDGRIYLLFDNYFSRADLRTSFMYADRKKIDEAYKKSRKKEKREFYNSINFLKYFYLINKDKYYTLQITNLEADDLVKPLLSGVCKDKSCLLVSSDLDWCRYLNNTPKIDWLPNLSDKPKTVEDISQELDFKVNEISITLYKTIFGDESDEIPNLVPFNEDNRKLFSEMMKKISYPEELILLSRDRENIEKNNILKAISLDEKRFIVNLQLVSSIPCKEEVLKKELKAGNNNETLLKVVSEAIGLIENPKQFVFGGKKF